MGRYLVQHPLLYLFLKTTDGFFSLFTISKRPLPKTSYRKILFCHTGHLGDLVIATSVLPVVKKAFPHAAIGFVLGSWSQVVLEGHPDIDHLHVLDHWKNNRSEKPLWKKVIRYYKSFFRAYRELRKIRYDAAIDLNFHFPNAIFLIACAHIPCRIGYASGGFGSLLTDPMNWSDQEHYVSGYYKDLLKKLGIQELFLQDIQPSLSPVGEKETASLSRKLSLPAQEKGYVILHIGSGVEKKEWLLEKWKNLAKRFADEDVFVVFTGRGSVEKEKIASVMQGLSKAQSLCDALDWQELVVCIQNAKLLISIDTALVHIACAFGTPTLVLFSGMNSPLHWCPPSARTLHAPMECFPCFNNRCSSRNCLLLLKEEDVFSKAKQLLL